MDDYNVDPFYTFVKENPQAVGLKYSTDALLERTGKRHLDRIVLESRQANPERKAYGS